MMRAAAQRRTSDERAGVGPMKPILYKAHNESAAKDENVT